MDETGVDEIEILKTFIEDQSQNEKTDSSQTCSYYVYNSEAIINSLKSAHEVLTQPERKLLYRQLLAIGKISVFKNFPSSEFETIKSSYDEFKVDYKPFRRDHLIMLFIFGSDQNGVLPSGAVEDAKSFQARVNVINQCGKYSHLEGRLAKLDKFQLFVDFAPVILESLRHLKYEASPDPKELFAFSDLRGIITGFMIIALLSPSTAVSCLEDIWLDNKINPPRYAERCLLLFRLLNSIVPFSDSKPLNEAAAPLNEWVRKCTDRSESVRLAKKLSLPFMNDEGWFVNINCRDNNCSLRLTFAPNEWSIYLDQDTKARYIDDNTKIEWAKAPIRNDLQVTRLTSLESFPTWLKATSSKLDLNIVEDEVKIYCGRKRSAVKILKKWIFSDQ